MYLLSALIIILSLLFPSSSLAQNFSVTQTSTSDTIIEGEHIQDFQVGISIESDGHIIVAESILYDFGELDRHGIYRYIPYTKVDQTTGKKYRMNIKVLSVKDEKGNPYHYQTTSQDDQFFLKIGDPDKTISGVHKYIISYLVSGALGYFSNHDELYWNLTGTDWEVPIAQSSAIITIPNSITESQVNLDCFTGSYGTTEKNCAMDIGDHTVTIESSRYLQPNEGLTAVIGFPKGHVAFLPPDEVIPFGQTLLGKIVFTLIGLLALFWYLIYPIQIMVKWFKHGRDPRIATGQVRAWFDPPKASNGRLLTPAETGALIDEQADIKDVLAMLIDLARRGYLKIIEEKKKILSFGKTDITLVKKKEADSKLQPFEKKFLNGIFEDGDEVKVSGSDLYETVKKAQDDIYEQMVADKLFPENPQKIRTFYTVIGALAIFSFNILLVISAFVFGRNLAKKTVLGAQGAAVAKSLKNFLSTQERQLTFQAKNQMFFEKLLPYAVAFGVEKLWAERFADIKLKNPTWYQGNYSSSSFNSAVLASSLQSSFSSLAAASHPPSSSGSGFSGGSSGGGGGGGGGGSW